MLNLSQVAVELPSVGTSAETNRNRVDYQLSVATAIATINSDTWAVYKDRINTAQSYLTAAKLMEATPIATSIAPTHKPSTYTVIAVDGSQIPLDRHAALPYFLINIGSVVLHYGTGERPLLASESKFYHKDVDISTSRDGEMSFITENEISDLRSTLEINKAYQLLSTFTIRNPLLLLIDGPIILWAQDPNNAQKRAAPAIKELCSLISTANVHRSIVAGYISRPGSREVVSVLKKAVTIVPELSNIDPTVIDRITDAQLFAKLLPNGCRSALFESQAKVLKSYESTANRVGFFYLNTGEEIARIEIPIEKTGENKATLAHALVLDQVSKGFSYPVSLAEAHEQAVVTADDRRAVNQLIHNQMLKLGLPIVFTRKSISKRTRPI